jgi:hypothetical protein
MILPLVCALSLIASPFNLQNGDFQKTADGLATGWAKAGEYKVVPGGGRNGLSALEIESSGAGSNAAVQRVKLDPPIKKDFAVTAWVRCEGVGEGGDCALWLDVLQDGGKPLWGIRGEPKRSLKGWQQVRAEVRPDHPVSEVQVYLILRDVQGKVRFCDVLAEPLLPVVNDFEVYPTDVRAYDVRASLSEKARWELRAEQDGREFGVLNGEGTLVTGRFTAPGDGPVKVIIKASSENGSVGATASAKPRVIFPAIDWWVADSFTRVFQDDLPPSLPRKQAALDAARNDRESFQICVRPTRQALKNVRVSISDMSYGKNRIPASAVEWSRVGYLWVASPFRHPFSGRYDGSWWPEPLLPAAPFDVEAGQVQPVWFTVHVPKNAAPGTYKGDVTIASAGVPDVKVPVSVSVYTAAIPDQGYMKTSFALMDGFLEKLYGEITPKLRRSYTDYLLAHHINPDDISRTSTPDLNELQYADSRGLNAFNILNAVPEPKSKVLLTCYAELNEYTPEFKERFFQRLDEIMPELEKRGLADKAYIYGFDERGPEYIPVIRDIFGEIKRRYPKVHTQSTCWPPRGTDPLSMNVDWYVQLTSSYDHELAQKARKRGGEVWWYVSCGPNYPYANWLLENPLIEVRLIFWQAFSYDVEGFLYWGMNIWWREHNDKPIPASAGPRLDWSVTTGGDYPSLNGDGVLLYPGENAPIGSIRLENIRDGLEDAELLHAYKSRFGADRAAEIVRKIAPNRTQYTREPRDLLSARLTVLKSLR